MEICKIFVVLFVGYLQGTIASTSSNTESSGCAVASAASSKNWKHIVRKNEWELKNDYCGIVFDGLDEVINSLTTDSKSVLVFPDGCPNPKDSDERGSFNTGDVTQVKGKVDKEKGSVKLVCEFKTRTITYETSSQTVVNPLKYNRCILGKLNDIIDRDNVIAPGLHASVAKKYCHELGIMEDRFLDSLKLAELFSSDEKSRKYWGVPEKWSFLMSRFEVGKGYIAMFDHGLLMVSLSVGTGKELTKASVFGLDFKEEFKRFGIGQAASDQAAILEKFFTENDLLRIFRNSEPSRARENEKIQTIQAFASRVRNMGIRVTCYDFNRHLVATSHSTQYVFEDLYRNENGEVQVPKVSKGSGYIWSEMFDAQALYIISGGTPPEIKVITYYLCRDLEAETKIFKGILESVSKNFESSINEKKKEESKNRVTSRVRSTKRRD